MITLSRMLPAAVTAIGLSISTPLLAAEDAPSADMVLARVGDIEITLGNVIALRADLPEQYGQIPAELIFSGMLDQLIRHALLNEAHKGDLSPLAKLRLENETRAITAEDEAAIVTKEAVTDEAVQKMYDDEFANAPQELEYHAAHILLETEDEAKAVSEEAKNGADFAELAKEKSTGPTGPDGGDLGWFSDGMMMPEFFEAVKLLKPDEISDPVKTEFGWHVIKLMETRDKERPTLEEVRDQIVLQLNQAALDAKLTELETEFKVERTDLTDFDLNVINNTDLLEK